jgi:hypothetical protein
MTKPLTAPALDDLLCQLTAEQKAALNRRANPALVDQLRAAQAESVALMELAENQPGGARALPHADIDEWLRLGLLDTLCKWVKGTARTCMHAPDPRHPQPAWAAAWKPGLIVCTHCLPLLKLFGDKDRTCDLCGRICAGLDHGDGIYTMTVWFGGLAFSAGMCAECRPNCTQAAS